MPLLIGKCKWWGNIHFGTRWCIYSIYGGKKLYGCQHSSKYLIFVLVSTEEKISYRFRVTQWSVNYDKMFIFEWTVPLKHSTEVIVLVLSLLMCFMMLLSWLCNGSPWLQSSLCSWPQNWLHVFSHCFRVVGRRQNSPPGHMRGVRGSVTM